MTKNKMKQVAELLGVEIGEEFSIQNYDLTWRITEDGLEYSCVDGWDKGSPKKILCLLKGELEIKKLPWRPKKGDYYYYPEIDTGAIISARAIYDYENSEHNIISNGLACKTRREAEELKAWIVEQVKKYRGID